MTNNQKSLSVSEVTVDRMMSHYLWNSPSSPSRENMTASVTHAERTAVKVDAVDYMQKGAGS